MNVSVINFWFKVCSILRQFYNQVRYEWLLFTSLKKKAIEFRLIYSGDSIEVTIDYIESKWNLWSAPFFPKPSVAFLNYWENMASLCRNSIFNYIKLIKNVNGSMLFFRPLCASLYQYSALLKSNVYNINSAQLKIDSRLFGSMGPPRRVIDIKDIENRVMQVCKNYDKIDAKKVYNCI